MTSEQEENNIRNPLDEPASHSDLMVLLQKDLIDRSAYQEALRVSGILPDKAAWRDFMKMFLATMGTLFLVSGIIFFFAFNWAEMGKWQKFGLIQIGIVLTGGFAWYKGPDTYIGRMGLFLLAGLIGVLFAVFGQIYQTGADPYELFGYWALMVLPLALISFFSPLWLFWLVLVNTFVVLFLFQGLGIQKKFYLYFLVPFIVNMVALVLWEAGFLKGLTWLRERFTPRLIMTACLTLATILCSMFIIMTSFRFFSRAGFAGWEYLLMFSSYLAVILVSYFYYQKKRHDLYILAMTLLSLGAVSIVWITSTMRPGLDHLLLLAVIVLIEGGVAIAWIRRKQLEWAEKS